MKHDYDKFQKELKHRPEEIIHMKKLKTNVRSTNIKTSYFIYLFQK